MNLILRNGDNTKETIPLCDEPQNHTLTHHLGAVTLQNVFRMSAIHGWTRLGCIALSNNRLGPEEALECAYAEILKPLQNTGHAHPQYVHSQKAILFDMSRISGASAAAVEKGVSPVRVIDILQHSLAAHECSELFDLGQPVPPISLSAPSGATLTISDQPSPSLANNGLT